MLPPTPFRYPYSPTPCSNRAFSRQGQNSSDDEGDITLGALIDKYLPQSCQKPPYKQKSASRRSPSAKGKRCVWLRTRRSWSESDLRILDIDTKVLDILDLDNKGEYELKVPLKKFIPSNKKSVKPSPRCCSNFARRKYPRTTLPAKANGRNCKKNLLGKVEGKKPAQLNQNSEVLPKIQCYKIRFHQDSRLDKGMVMSTQIEVGNRVERVEGDVLFDQFPECRVLHQRDHSPVKCECRSGCPETVNISVAGQKVNLETAFNKGL